MFLVGLTGGIGSGKSTVCNIFRELGVPIIDTDDIARQVVTPGSAGLERLQQEFGPEILSPDGSLNRARLRHTIFSNAEKRQRLEDIIHPLIRMQLKEQLTEINAPYVIVAIPLLLEKGWQNEVDRILVVDSTEQQQVERTLARDECDRELVNKIIQSQSSRQQRLAAADDIIHNDSDMAALHTQVELLHRQYTDLALNA